MIRGPEATLAGPTELVTCMTHKTRRMAKFCIPKPTFNADGRTVGFTYSCAKESECTARQTLMDQMMGPVAAGPVEHARPSELPRAAAAVPPSLGTSGGLLTAAPQPQLSSALRGRYYDLSVNQSGDSNVPKKVCWWCGMDDHEKYQCQNQLCRRCHGPMGRDFNAHMCHAAGLSSFVLLEDLTEEQLATVQCPKCGDFGHLDCSSAAGASAVAKGRQLSCCFCGGEGHQALSCPHVRTDPWREQQQRLADSARHHHHHHHHHQQQRQRGDRHEEDWQQQGGRHCERSQHFVSDGYGGNHRSLPHVAVGAGSAPYRAATNSYYAGEPERIVVSSQNQHHSVHHHHQREKDRDYGRSDRRRGRSQDRRDLSRSRRSGDASGGGRWRRYEPPRFTPQPANDQRLGDRHRHSKRRRSDSDGEDFQF
jgi:hypothetical protein